MSGFLSGKSSLTVVTAADIQDGAITSAKIANDAITEAKVANDAIGLTELKAGTDGQILTWDASGNPTTVAVGTSGHFLKSAGSGSVPTFAAAGGGKVLAIYYDTIGQRQSTTSYTPVDVTGLAITLTPASTASKFLIHSDLKGGSDSYTMNSLIVRTIGSGSATFIGLGDTTGKSNSFATGGSSMYSNLNEGNPGCVQTFLDSPSTTSQIVYKMQFKTGQSGNSCALHTKASDVIGNSATNSSLTIYEIGA